MKKTKTTLRRRLTRMAIALVTLVALPLILGWIYLAQPVLGPAGGPDLAAAGGAAPVDPGRLERHVRMLSETFVPRDYLHPENLDRCADYIRTAFAAAGGRTSDQVYEHGSTGTRYRNVVAHFGPELGPAGERVVVGAHYDAFREYPGADDNASGVAGLIELAALLGKAGDGALGTPVELVAYSLEEPPFFGGELMGSAVHARRLAEDGASVRLMISLEMIGTFSDAPGSQSYPVPLLRLYYPGRGNFVAVVSDLDHRAPVLRVKKAMRSATALPVHSLNGPGGLPGIDFSDHRNYWAEGFPAIMVTDTAFYRNTHYHTPEDTADRLDYQRMAQVVTGVSQAVLEVAR